MKLPVFMPLLSERPTFRRAALAGIAASLLLGGCNGHEPFIDDQEPAPAPEERPVEAVTQDRAHVGYDPAVAIGGPITAQEAAERARREGPPVFRSRVHGCRKMRYETLGQLLGGLGVDMDATDELSAGAMYRESDQALGAPNYEARTAEATEMTVASSSRLFDILVQAAPEIIAGMPESERCPGAEVFNEDGDACTTEGLSCLLGEPADGTHLAVCEQLIGLANDPEEGRQIVVASLLASMFVCE